MEVPARNVETIQPPTLSEAQNRATTALRNLKSAERTPRGMSYEMQRDAVDLITRMPQELPRGVNMRLHLNENAFKRLERFITNKVQVVDTPGGKKEYVLKVDSTDSQEDALVMQYYDDPNASPRIQLINLEERWESIPGTELRTKRISRIPFPELLRGADIESIEISSVNPSEITNTQSSVRQLSREEAMQRWLQRQYEDAVKMQGVRANLQKITQPAENPVLAISLERRQQLDQQFEFIYSYVVQHSLSTEAIKTFLAGRQISGEDAMYIETKITDTEHNFRERLWQEVYSQGLHYKGGLNEWIQKLPNYLQLRYNQGLKKWNTLEQQFRLDPRKQEEYLRGQLEGGKIPYGEQKEFLTYRLMDIERKHLGQASSQQATQAA